VKFPEEEENVSPNRVEKIEFSYTGDTSDVI
jgi:hypothetical protein